MPNIQMIFTKCPCTMNPELTIQDPQKSDPTPLSNSSGDYNLIRTTYYKQREIVTPHNQKCHMQGYFSSPFLECMPLHPPPFSISSLNLTLPPRVNNSILNQALYPQKQPGSNLTSMWSLSKRGQLHSWDVQELILSTPLGANLNWWHKTFGTYNDEFHN